MEATALVLLAAVGVGYGWQPMPDGSSRYEYVVQIEPELLATLGEDGSIPIVSEVPEDIRPIGRIRVVVGRGDLPRERLVKRMKPAGEGAVELAQYNQFGAPDSRYGQPSAASPDASSWNGGAAESAGLAPPDRGAGATWNNAPVSVAERTTEQGPMARVGDHIDDATAPLRQGLEKVDDGVRAAVGNLGDRTRNLVDELGRPFQPRPNQPDNGAPVGTNPNITTAPTWNGGDAAGVPTPAAAPASRYDGQSNSWNGSDAASLPEAPAFAGASPGAAAPGAGQPNSGSADWNAPGPAGAPASQRLDQPIDPRDVGRWDNAAPSTPASGTNAAPPLVGRGGANPDNIDYRRQADAARQSPGAADNPAGFPADWAHSGQRSPSFDNSPDANAAAPRADAVARETEPTDATSPKIDSRMLQQPASRPLEGTDSAQAAASNVAGPEFPAAGQRAATNSPQTPAARPGANGQGWDLPTRGAANQQAGAQIPASGSGRQTAAALFAWVLLTSSAAGNLYLFWSYQDVRYKYRALVRKTARAVGSRLSAA